MAPLAGSPIVTSILDSGEERVYRVESRRENTDDWLRWDDFDTLQMARWCQEALEQGYPGRRTRVLEVRSQARVLDKSELEC